ncbi:unnamed protein product [Trichobilharzia regenti]|nr:unnamed protein product [Trichobilharzia regenti]
MQYFWVKVNNLNFILPLHTLSPSKINTFKNAQKTLSLDKYLQSDSKTDFTKGRTHAATKQASLYRSRKCTLPTKKSLYKQISSLSAQSSTKLKKASHHDIMHKPPMDSDINGTKDSKPKKELLERIEVKKDCQDWISDENNYSSEAEDNNAESEKFINEDEIEGCEEDDGEEEQEGDEESDSQSTNKRYEGAYQQNVQGNLKGVSVLELCSAVDE